MDESVHAFVLWFWHISWNTNNCFVVWQKKLSKKIRVKKFIESHIIIGWACGILCWMLIVVANRRFGHANSVLIILALTFILFTSHMNDGDVGTIQIKKQCDAISYFFWQCTTSQEFLLWHYINVLFTFLQLYHECIYFLVSFHADTFRLSTHGKVTAFLHTSFGFGHIYEAPFIFILHIYFHISSVCTCFACSLPCFSIDSTWLKPTFLFFHTAHLWRLFRFVAV